MAELCRLSSGDASSTHAIAASLARQCRAGDCIKLRGDLGAGKTTFARGFIGALHLGHEEVLSPTFTLVQAYPAGNGGMIWHFDLYRLRSREEIAEIGLDEALQDGITLIEWPELVQSELPAEALDVNIIMGDRPEERTLTFGGLASAWGTRLNNLKG